ncbi:TIGR03905 family TSCPD domain-containing protein [Candidatus Allofournierella merdavium]|uniref:TIGR03905 family TSCPD domain-containing protein n=1 Tax=Candidatus Allofournierella merdavium TaxID=2838593 RepID=UPI00374E80FF
MITHTRKNSGTCSRSTTVTLNDDGTIQKIEVTGGCNGNLKGVSSLLVGMDATDAIRRMKGTTCGPRSTSCPDQIAQALQETLDLQKRS